MRSSSAAHVSVRPRDPNRVLLYKQSSSSKRRSRGDAVQFKAKLSGFLSLLIAFVCLGGLLAINFHPYPAEGDIVVAAGRKELSTASGGSSAAVELYTLLESLVDIDGRPLSQSSDIRDKVLLISNVASQCGFTRANYENFQRLLQDHYAAGLRIVAIPCNDFGHQESGSDADIRKFVRETYELPSTPITLVRKMEDDINEQNEVFRYLRDHGPGGQQGLVSWNFHKWLVDRHGVVRYRYDSADHKDDLERDILSLL